jgi:L-malate glycosyltransferase
LNPSSEKPLLVQVITTLGGGGAEREVARFAPMLYDNGPYRVVVCCVMGSGGFVGDVEKCGVEVVVLNERKRSAPVIAGQLLRFLRKRKPVIVHSHMVSWAPMTAKLAGVPAIVVTEHGLHESRRSIGVFVEIINNFFVDRVVAVADAVREYRIKRWHTPAAKIVTIPNAVRVTPVLGPAEVAAKKQELVIPHDALVVGMAGRLEAIKGWNYFIDSCAQIAKVEPSSRFLVVGDGPVRGEIEDQVKRLQLSDHVHVLGFRDDVRELMRVMDVVCLSSLTEGTPITILEAMACARPAVVTDVGGCAQVVIDGVTGFVVPPRDPAALADATLKLLRDADLARRMGEAGLERVLDHYSVETNLKNWLDLYALVLRRKGQ